MPEGREQVVLRFQTILEGGLYGSSWQDQEESPSEEEGRWQEKEVSCTLSEAIH
jgi:hypothetical protein